MKKNEKDKAKKATQAPEEAMSAAQEETTETEETTSTDELTLLNDKYIRLAAEFDNYRKRTNKEKADLISRAGEDVMLSVLEVIDDTDRAKDQIEKSEDIESLRTGVQLIFNKLRTVLQQKGLKEMTSTGEVFDPELHEAVTEIPAPSEEWKGKVVDTIQKGYYLNDKIIRHAKVVVGK